GRAHPAAVHGDDLPAPRRPPGPAHRRTALTPRTPTITPAGPAPGARTSRPARRLRPVLLGACLLLGGCAAQHAWRQGHDLIAEGRPAEGLAQLAAASRIDPGSARYRIDYLSERDRYVG